MVATGLRGSPGAEVWLTRHRPWHARDHGHDLRKVGVSTPCARCGGCGISAEGLAAGSARRCRAESPRWGADHRPTAGARGVDGVRPAQRAGTADPAPGGGRVVVGRHCGAAQPFAWHRAQLPVRSNRETARRESGRGVSPRATKGMAVARAIRRRDRLAPPAASVDPCGPRLPGERRGFTQPKAPRHPFVTLPQYAAAAQKNTIVMRS